MRIVLSSKKLKLLKKISDRILIVSDGLSPKSARIGGGFGLFLSDFESDNFISDRIGFASNSDYTAIPSVEEPSAFPLFISLFCFFVLVFVFIKLLFR